MTDLIDRKEAIECVKELFSMGGCYCDEYSIVCTLNGLPPVTHDEWTPCSETDGLPPKAGRYLVTWYFRDHGWDKGAHVGFDTFRGKTSWAKKKDKQVVAWMPVPKEFEE